MQLVTPRFPTQAYIGAVWIHAGDEVKDGFSSFPYAFEELYTDPNQFIHDALLIPQIPAYGSHINLSTASILMPVSLVEKVPLHPQKRIPKLKYESNLRLKNFVKAMQNTNDYHVLVTPEQLKGKRVFNPTFPFLKEAHRGSVELFLNTTDHSTDIAASHAAIYKIDQLIVVDLTTREIMRTATSEAVH